MIFDDLVKNLALLVACGTVYGFVAHRLNAPKRLIQIYGGVLFGGVAIAGMVIPFHYAPGIIFDGRSAVLCIAGLFGGPIAGVVAAAIASAYRLWLGGAGALTGVGVAVTASALGVGLYYKSRKQPQQVPAWQLYALGVVVHVSMLLWMFSLPWPSPLGVLGEISLPVMVIFPLATLLLGSLLSDMERRHVEQKQLRASWQQYSAIVDTQTELVDRWLPDGTLTFVNAAYCRYYGKTERELVGRNRLRTMSDEDGDGREEHVRRMRVSLTPDAPIRRTERREVAAGGEIRWVSWIDHGIFDENGVLEEVQSTGRDITERVRAQEERLAMEAQLRRSQKLESIGTLASGVAHEINNPLMGMINYADLIADEVEDETAKKYSRIIMKEGNRIAEIVRNLLSFSRQDKETHSPADINDIVAAALSLVGSLLRKDQIAVELDIPEDLPEVKCRSQQIQQVMVNLLTNARDALNERYPEYHEHKLVRITARPLEKDKADWVRTTVEDHGCGIPEDNLQRIFDPFYTTKPRDAGTGLGLSVSFGIVREHHGELTVESVPGEYMRFHMDLRVNNEWSVKEQRQAKA